MSYAKHITETVCLLHSIGIDVEHLGKPSVHIADRMLKTLDRTNTRHGFAIKSEEDIRAEKDSIEITDAHYEETIDKALAELEKALDAGAPTIKEAHKAWLLKRTVMLIPRKLKEMRIAYLNVLSLRVKGQETMPKYRQLVEENAS